MSIHFQTTLTKAKRRSFFKSSTDAKTITILCFALLVCRVQCQRIAIIGEGISGSFTAKYLADYDAQCQSDGIIIFEAVPLYGPQTESQTAKKDWQGSRVTSLQLKNGINIELGASIGYLGFHLLLDMIRHDPLLEIGEPFTTSVEGGDDPERSMGLYMGDSQWAFRTWHGWKLWNKFLLALRYNFDLMRVSKLLKQALANFETLPRLLDSRDADTFFESPDQIWDRLGFLPAVHSSFASFLDAAGVPDELPWWRQYLPFQGSLRQELLTAINLVNYNQNIHQVNGIVGLGSFAAASGTIFSVKGGNHGIIRSAIQQAKNARTHHGCFEQVRQESKTITHVIGSLAGLNLFAGEEDLGIFDAVVLAAPLHASQIQFMVQSEFDAAVLQPMPLGGLVDTEEDPDKDSHEGHAPLISFLPASIHRPYVQVVTTILSQAKLNGTLLGMEPTPRSVLFTDTGKASLHNITAITRIHSSGVYKVFSSDVLPEDVKTSLFGPNVQTKYVKVWGGPYGGATPDYQGRGDSISFQLYDAATGLQGHTASGALYYPNALELSSLACMEIAAVGAKAVAKLMARRFGWIQKEDKGSTTHDEL